MQKKTGVGWWRLVPLSPPVVELGLQLWWSAQQQQLPRLLRQECVLASFVHLVAGGRPASCTVEVSLALHLDHSCKLQHQQFQNEMENSIHVHSFT